MAVPASVGGVRVLEASGVLLDDARWEGTVHVTGDLLVPPGVTLTLMPGTVVLLSAAGTGGEGPEPGAIDVRGGRLVACGTPAAPIRFLSDSPTPRPGDWRCIQLRDACPDAESRIAFALVEHARIGVLVWNAAPVLEDLVVRRCRWEGIYAEGHAAPAIRRCISRDNGYNGIALEQFNRVRIEDSLLAGNGTHGLHCDLSAASLVRCRIEGNLHHGVSADNGAEVRLERCRILANRLHGVGLDAGAPRVRIAGCEVAGNGAGGANCRAGSRLEAAGCSVQSNRPIQLHTHDPTDPHELGGNWWGAADRPHLERELTGEGDPATCAAHFWPDWGAPLSAPPPPDVLEPRLAAARAIEAASPASPPAEPRPYVATDDATRRIARRIGAGLGLPWSVTAEPGPSGAIWTATLDTDLLLRLDPVTGEVLARFPTPGPQSWGLAYDGSSLWLNDFARLELAEVDPATGRVLSRFPVPSRLGGAKGVTWTGTHLALLGWRDDVVWWLDRSGRVLRTTPAPLAKGGLAWDGERFWAPHREWILAFEPEGTITGAITAASDGTWDLEWQGKLLWAAQRGCETAAGEPKLYALDVLDRERLDVGTFRDRASRVQALARGELRRSSGDRPLRNGRAS